jgi:hypothetical protein
MIADDYRSDKPALRKDVVASLAVINPMTQTLNGVTSRELELLTMPMAFQLDEWFRRHGVVVAPLEELDNKHGQCGVSEPGRLVYPWTQLNVNKPSGGEVLAKTIVNRFGAEIAFSQIVIPRSGIECAGYSRSGNVWVRRVVCYQIASDELVQRWDVLVRAVK